MEDENNEVYDNYNDNNSVPVVISGKNSSSNKIMAMWKRLLAVLAALHMK